MNPQLNPFNHSMWQNGPSPGDFYNFPGHNQTNPNSFDKQFQAKGDYGSQRSSQPITTGTSVVGVKYDKGVIIAADNLISYGSLARFTGVNRVFKVNSQSIIGVGGDFADFQYMKQHIDQKTIEDAALNDTHELKPKSLYNWLMRILYNRRSRFNPLWLDMVVGGMQNGEPFLGHVNLRGRSYEDTVVATGYGQHLALPLLREHSEVGPLTKEKAIELTKKCMEVLFYRDCRAFPQYTMAVCSAEGVTVEGPIEVSQNWELAHMIKGYA